MNFQDVFAQVKAALNPALYDQEADYQKLRKVSQECNLKLALLDGVWSVEGKWSDVMKFEKRIQADEILSSRMLSPSALNSTHHANDTTVHDLAQKITPEAPDVTSSAGMTSQQLSDADVMVTLNNMSVIGESSGSSKAEVLLQDTRDILISSDWETLERSERRDVRRDKVNRSQAQGSSFDASMLVD